MTSRLARVGDAISQLFNVIIYNGDPNYSISGESYRKNRKLTMKLIDKIFYEGHCKSAYRDDLDRASKLLIEVGRL